MQKISATLKPATRLVDVLVMALAAYFALHAGAGRISNLQTDTAPAGHSVLISTNISVS